MAQFLELHHGKAVFYMKPVTLFVAIALCIVPGIFNNAKAQHLVFIFAHPVYESPVDKDFKNNYSFGLGAEGGVGIGAGRTFFIGTIGYSYFNARSNAEKPIGNLNYVPIKVGFRHYILVGKVLFINADAGVATITDRSTHTSSSRFTADIGPGVKLGPFEAIVNYDGFARSDPSGYASWLAFKLGWRIGL
jgi:hypothetical protein